MTKASVKITTHGHQQLEWQVNYPLHLQIPDGIFQMEAFVFCPAQLRVNKDHYGVGRFLADLTTYTRYRVPEISLQQLLDPDNDLSPLLRLSRSICGEQPLAPDAFEHELKTLVNITHAALKQQRKEICNHASRSGPGLELEEQISTFLHTIKTLSSRIRSDIVQPMEATRQLPPTQQPCPAALHQWVCWADEAISLNIEKQLFLLWEKMDASPAFAACAHILVPELTAESRYRAMREYPSVARPEAPRDNEHFVYRQGTLKKWAESSLYMTLAQTAVTHHLAQIVMGTAAGLAMLFAIMTTLLAESYFPRNSTPWIILAVVAYIFKDRLKELLRGWMVGRIPQLIADRIENLFSPLNHVHVGRSRANVNFLKSDDIPDDIHRCRKASANEFAPWLAAEDVLVFRKQIRIRSGYLRKHYPRLSGIVDILRIRIQDWLSGMDDPEQTVRIALPGKGVSRIPTPRVYHFHIIVRLQEQGQAATYTHIRMYANRSGIVRMQTLLEGVTAERLPSLIESDEVACRKENPTG